MGNPLSGLGNPLKTVKNIAGNTILGMSAGLGPQAKYPGGVNPAQIPQGFNTSGLSGVYNPTTRSFDISRSSGLTGLLNNITSRSDQLAGDIGGLIPLVRPGVSELRNSRLAGLENRRRQAIGNLKDNLSRRRIMGSSFANNAVTQAELAYQEEADRIRAESTLTELDQTQKLLQSQAQAQLQAMNAMLSQFNIDASLGAQLSGAATNAIQQALQFNQQLAFNKAEGIETRNAQAMSGFGDLLGTAVGLGGL